MNRLEKIKQEFFEQFTDKLKEEKVDISVESAFDILISADPSRNKKNVRWLIETYLNDGFLWEDIQSGEYSKVHETLNVFIRNKNKLDILDRSINRYESIADMWKMVKQYAEDKTGKEIKREEYDRAMDESEIVIDNDDIRVVVPLTEYASKFHGRGTRWCTAADNHNMFWNYAEKEPLFVITLKGSGDKLQIWKDGSDVQFMDSDDKTVSKEYIEQNWDKLKPIVLYFLNIQFIPPEFRTYDLYKDIVYIDASNINFIPHELQNHELYEIACQTNGISIWYTPKEYITPELCKLAVQQNGKALDLIPEEFLTPELCKIACEQDGRLLRYVPDEYITPELCKIACEQNGLSLEYVPDMTHDGIPLKTPELCKLACEQDGKALEYTPNEFKTIGLCKLACECNGYAIDYIPERLQSNKKIMLDLYILGLKTVGSMILYIPKDELTYQMCLDAVKSNCFALQSIPEELITPELCQIAVRKDGTSLSEIPTQFLNYELYKEAIKETWAAFFNIPIEHLTSELCEIALSHSPDAKRIESEIPEHLFPKNVDKLLNNFFLNHNKEKINKFKEYITDYQQRKELSSHNSIIPSIEPSQTMHHTM